VTVTIRPKTGEGSAAYTSFGMRFYRIFFRWIFSLFGRGLVGADRWTETLKLPKLVAAISEKRTGEKRIWFHAASMGELESLWPLVERAAIEPDTRLILTVFSTSAWSHLHKMARKLDGAAPLYTGYSPLEGGWRWALESLKPNLFITAKYEAWPEIWDSLAVLDIPLAIIGAKPRSSILWAKRILRIFNGSIPRILFFSFDSENEPGLAKRFPAAKLYHGSDPRWDRVFQRSENSHPRVAELAQEFADLPRPWGAIGSAWAPDLSALPEDAASSIPGTLWIVPHKITPRSISELEILLRERGFTPIRTSLAERIRPAGKIAVLVDEMGFLAELYSQMEWAFIGGGFGSSIHSTIEPAIYGLPIYGGPKGQQKFDEIPLLKKQSQLRLFGDPRVRGKGGRSAEDFLEWLRSEFAGDPGTLDDRRQEWKEANRRHRGASERIWARLFMALNGDVP
jgi:3-deoxy-D-manno-octulosonic-acid transferase